MILQGVLELAIAQFTVRSKCIVSSYTWRGEDTAGGSRAGYCTMYSQINVYSLLVHMERG